MKEHEIKKIQEILGKAKQVKDGWKISNEDHAFLCHLFKVAFNLDKILTWKDVRYKGKQLNELEKNMILEIAKIVVSNKEYS